MLISEAQHVVRKTSLWNLPSIARRVKHFRKQAALTNNKIILYKDSYLPNSSVLQAQVKSFRLPNAYSYYRMISELRRKVAFNV